jgi:two-component system nitrogen regulation sensor histidine kinase GlnL
MFDVHDGRGVRRFAAGLALLSLIALTVTAWIFYDVAREQQIVSRIIGHLPESDMAVANELSGDLQLRSRLSFLLVLNIAGTGIAFAIVVRGYLTSERSLRDAKVLATDILASMDSGVITTDGEGRMSSLNPRAHELIGLDNDAAIGKSLAEIGDEHALLESICSKVNSQHNAIRDRDYTVMRGSHEQTLRAGCTLLRNERDEEIGTVIHVRDVTEKALMEQRLRRMERYMGLGSLAAGLQHEIKNPLSALSLHIQLLCERLAKNSRDDEVEELLDVLRTEVARISSVLDSFRNYASEGQLGRSWVDVTILIEKLVRFLNPQTKKQKVVVKVDFPKPSLGMIEADFVRLEQVLLNLALNALAAMPDGGTLRFGLSKQEDSLRIDVEDTGSGIPLEIQPQIFDP